MDWLLRGSFYLCLIDLVSFLILIFEGTERARRWKVVAKVRRWRNDAAVRQSIPTFHFENENRIETQKSFKHWVTGVIDSFVFIGKKLKWKRERKHRTEPSSDPNWRKNEVKEIESIGQSHLAAQRVANLGSDHLDCYRFIDDEWVCLWCDSVSQSICSFLEVHRIVRGWEGVLAHFVARR